MNRPLSALNLCALRGAAIAVTALALSGCAASSRGAHAPSVPSASEQPVGSPPLCEPSAAVRAPWDHGLILVADDDVRRNLFAFELDANGLLTNQRPLPLLSGDGPDDLEALAVVGDQVVAVGSHGRDARCRLQPATEGLDLLSWLDQEVGLGRVRLITSSDRMRRATASRGSCLEELFVSPAPAFAAEVCDAIVGAEAALDASRCIPPLDIEGATALTTTEGGDGPRLWVGLRRPRVEQGAVLLRLVAGLGEIRFDGVCLLPVGDRGIRGLNADSDSVWVILGPAAPGWDRSTLWTAPASEVSPGSVARGWVAADGLPPSSEGVVLDGDDAILLTDGSAGARPGRCRRQPTQMRVPLQRPPLPPKR